MSGSGPIVAEITAQEFRDFAKHHATSPEVGPIATSLDGKGEIDPGVERVLVGLWGCERLCAVACLHVYRSTLHAGRGVLKLDSVVVDGRLRRRGLGGLLVAHAFADMVRGGARAIARIYAHAVHPATVRLLMALGFNEPQVTGAPISDAEITEESREAFLRACESQVRAHMDRMRLQCALCRSRDKRARPWCLPAGERPAGR